MVYKIKSKKRKYSKYPQRKLKVMKTPMPTQFTTKLRYCTILSLNPGLAGTPATHVFRCNSLFDPDATLIGHQPRGFDELMPFYDHFVVTSSKITAKFVNRSTQGPSTVGTSQNYVVGVNLNDDVTSLATPNDYMEHGDSAFNALCGVEGAQHVVTVSKIFTNEFLGRNDPMSDPDLKGSNSTNPNEQAYFQVFAAPLMSTTDAGPVDCYVVVEYVATFIEPKDLNQS